MRKRYKKTQINKGSGEMKAFKLNMIRNIILSGSIETTIQKAKFMQSEIESILHRAKKGRDFNNIRELLKTLRDKRTVDVLLNDIAPKIAERNGGYTSIKRIYERKGDNATMVRFSIVDLDNKID